MNPARSRAVAARSIRVVPTARRAGTPKGVLPRGRRLRGLGGTEIRVVKGERMIPWEGFDPKHDSPVGNACSRIAVLVSDAQWHSWTSIVSLVSAENGLQAKTVSNLLHGMRRTGCLVRRGEYSRSQLSGRQVRIAD